VRRRAALLIVLVVAGCGGSSAGPKSAYATKANSICRRYQRKINALPPPRSAMETRGLLDRTAALVAQELRMLRRLKPPREKRALVRRELTARADLLAAFRRDERLVVRYADEVAKGHRGTAAFRAITNDLDPRQEKVRRLDRKLGLTACLREFR
jgi:hypothetical protein